MPKVITAMIQAGMIAHEHVMTLGDHFITPKGRIDVPLPNIRTGDKIQKREATRIYDAISNGLNIGIVQADKRGSAPVHYILAPAWTAPVKAYYAAHK